MKPKTYQVLTMAVEEGVNYGLLNRAYKHSDNPTQEQIAAIITDSVLNSICEWFDFDNEHQ